VRFRQDITFGFRLRKKLHTERRPKLTRKRGFTFILINLQYNGHIPDGMALAAEYVDSLLDAPNLHTQTKI